MTRLLNLIAPPATFAGTASELRTYERAVAIWRAAGMHVRGQKFVASSLGARVLRSATLGAWLDKWDRVRDELDARDVTA